MPVGENCIVLIPGSSAFVIGVDSVVFFLRDGHRLLVNLLLIGLLPLVASGVDHVN